MRLLPASVLVLALFSFASGQTYTISTFAGGGLPVNIPGTTASLSPVRPIRQATSSSWIGTSSCDWTPQQAS